MCYFTLKLCIYTVLLLKYPNEIYHINIKKPYNCSAVRHNRLVTKKMIKKRCFCKEFIMQMAGKSVYIDKMIQRYI